METTGGLPLDAAVLDRAAQRFALDHHSELGECDEVGAGGLDDAESLVRDEDREVVLGEPAERLAHHGRAGVVSRRECGEAQWCPGSELAAQDIGADGVVDLGGPRQCLGVGHRARASSCPPSLVAP